METILGLIALGVPAILVGGIVLGRSRPILFMYLAAVVVGLGYLFTTGAVDDIGRQAEGYIGTSHPPAPIPAVAPAPAPAPAAPTPAPTPAPATSP